MTKTTGKARAISYRWQFVRPDFSGWPDSRPWTRIEAGPFGKGPVPEGVDGPVYAMPQKVIDDIALYLDDMARTFEMQKNETEAGWHRARTRSAERSMLVRVKIPEVAQDQPPAEMPA